MAGFLIVVYMFAIIIVTGIVSTAIYDHFFSHMFEED